MQDYKIQTELRHWLSNYCWNNPYAVTLTLKQKLKGLSITQEIASNSIKNFLSRISRKVLGNNHKRRKPLQRIATQETKNRLHYHIYLDLPDYDLNKTQKLINTNWNSNVIDFAYKQRRIDPVHSKGGWLKYITKFENDNDNIDWSNSFLDPQRCTVSEHYSQKL